MRAMAIVLIQVVMAAVVAGVAMPVLLLWVPQTREAGSVVLGLLVVILFAVLRFAWPAPRNGTPSAGVDGRDQPH